MSQPGPRNKKHESASERAARLRAAVQAGREKRSRNRAWLKQRELELEGAGRRGPVFEFVRVLLCGICYVPLLGYLLTFAMRADRRFGPVAGWVVGLAGCAVMAAIVYRGTRYMTACASDLVGILRGWRRDPETLWVGLALGAGALAMLASYVFKW